MLNSSCGGVFSVLGSNDGTKEHQIFDYQQLLPQIEMSHYSDIEDQYWTKTFKIDQRFGDLKDNITNEYSDSWIDSSLTNSPVSWQKFCRGLSWIFNSKEILPILTKQFVQLPQDLIYFQKKSVQAFTVILQILIELCRVSDCPSRLLKFISNFMLPKTYFEPITSQCEFMSFASPIKLYKNILFSKPEDAWAILTNKKHLTVLSNKTTKPIYEVDIESISQSFGKIRIITKQKTEIVFKCSDDVANNLWLRSQVTDLMWLDSLTPSFSKNYPPNFLYAFSSTLYLDDMLIIQALFSIQISQLELWDPIIDNLITLSISYGRLDSLVSFISFDEISQTSDPNLILRSNSICTHFLKVYYKRFGKDYINNVIIPLFNEVCKIPIDDIADESNDVEIIRRYILMFADTVMNSFDKIPRAIRHLATHIFYATECTLGTWEATFNSITNLFILRFFIAFFSSPSEMPISTVDSVRYKKVIIPFGAIMLNFLSCNGMSNKYEYLEPIRKDYYSYRLKLLEFFSSLPLRRNEPGQYVQPSTKEVETSSKFILDFIVDNKEQFLRQYRGLMTNENRYHPFSYRILHMLYSCLVHTEL
ncbi:hypothetical protein TVAG_277960 [Trichomonas vaginalis G3]|uniref:Ras-GAP domain-containing protein n=1 Tax=Trichomonas vaginalis (strain ATCC PRA-98 / G3) TaxID=412133 RepID=A2DU37_TRIV3|nr:GTPase activation domain, GAP family [Trichomonas vaginalis G3]EAY16030.1 hypothetical protein TVAG_277960 [Trichomonas vaginalis G3]KAI5537310.1 GTPase activation domain, GAP family [Trichomonas vaginalis G3]|eukprot:XP_001328253.1 hypothetical protein [Trichomonas vaginalis G3]